MSAVLPQLLPDGAAVSLLLFGYQHPSVFLAVFVAGAVMVAVGLLALRRVGRVVEADGLDEPEQPVWGADFLELAEEFGVAR